jgi:uncharacterized protein YutE (UPF0331/DUF86 family)
MLQTAIEACIDLTYHVCAKRLGQAPEDARDGLRRLDDLADLDHFAGIMLRLLGEESAS